VLLTALVLDGVVLGAFVWIKATSDPLVLIVSLSGMAVIFGAAWWFIRRAKAGKNEAQ
jgi:hypothetical protein